MSKYNFPKVKDIIFVFEDGSQTDYFWSNSCDSWIKNTGENFIDPDSIKQIFHSLADVNQLKGYD